MRELWTKANPSQAEISAKSRKSVNPERMQERATEYQLDADRC